MGQGEVGVLYKGNMRDLCGDRTFCGLAILMSVSWL